MFIIVKYSNDIVKYKKIVKEICVWRGSQILSDASGATRLYSKVGNHGSTPSPKKTVGVDTDSNRDYTDGRILAIT